MSAPAEEGKLPQILIDAILGPNEEMPADSEVVKGFDFNESCDLSKLLDTYYFTGFQAHNLGLAIKEVEKMVRV